MRRLYAILVRISLLGAIAASIIWWNYAALQWSYPRYKAETREWWWRHFGDPFDAQSRRIAGHRPVDCSPQTLSNGTLSKCIAGALRQHRGFQLRANFCGIDSCGATGVVGSADGTPYAVSFDVWHQFVAVRRRRCPMPLQVVTEDVLSGWGYTISCLPEATSEKQFEIIQDDLAEHPIRESAPSK